MSILDRLKLLHRFEIDRRGAEECSEECYFNWIESPTGNT